RLPLLLLLLIVGVCHAQPLDIFNELEDVNETEAWLAGVFTPQPLKPAPWQVEEPIPPEAFSIPLQNPPPPPSALPEGLQLPGVGELHGLRGYKTIKGKPIDAYLGVRYAQVNASGLGRFQAARPLTYQGRIDATRSSANCAQFPELQRLQEAEARGENVDDCLTLDVYAPAGARDLPVLVFVHGEMLFDGGAEEAQPEYVLEHDVILVSVNYRLAPFGFLAALSDELPGNVALSDLHLALEWVQHNIAYFGGASSRVTLIGQAAGATLAHALSLSPRTQHLFQQLILQSGTALNPYLLDERPLETLATFARLARCPLATNNLSPLYDCLSRQSTSQLVAVFEQLFQQNEPRGLTSLGGFKLVVGDRLGYLPDHPAALVVNNGNNNSTKPSIVGAAKDAGAFILSRFYDQIESLQSQNLSDYINVVLRHTAPPQHHKIWHDWALREIFGPEQVRYVSARSVSQGLLELSNLILYRAPVIDSIRSSYKKSPLYLYTFDYRGEYHRFGHLNNPLPFGVDASLSDDSVYLFPYPVEASQLNPEDFALARALTAMWVNFAQTGIPNPNANVWPKATSEYGPFLRFTNSRENTLELDQHFGEGINIPNLYPQYFKINTTAPVVPVATISVLPALPVPTPTVATTTTTTWRPYVLNNQRQPIRRPYRIDNRRPLPTHYTRVQQLELELEEKRLRELKERDEQERREQELRREQQQREQYEREQQQREQQQREQYEREQQQREQQQREQQQREQQQREQQQREQQQREQQQREQQEREQQQREQYEQNQPETQPQVEERDPYEEQRQQQAREEEERREQQWRTQYEQEQREREPTDGEQSELGPQEEEERERELQRQQTLREQYERDQRQREQEQRERQQQQQFEQEQTQESEPQEDEYQREIELRRQQALREQYEREQSQREQYEREQQQQREQTEQDQTEESVPQEDNRDQEQQRELELRRQQALREQYERDQRQREQQQREQQQREQQQQEQDNQQQFEEERIEESEPQEDDYQREIELRRQQALREQYERDQRQQEQYEQEQQQREKIEQDLPQESEPQEDNYEQEQQREIEL
ncbi:hypothetical protein KR222_000943, partial [Zaprionus bogoriensis]